MEITYPFIYNFQQNVPLFTFLNKSIIDFKQKVLEMQEIKKTFNTVIKYSLEGIEKSCC